jgi:hypothetical protein
MSRWWLAGALVVVGFSLACSGAEDAVEKKATEEAVSAATGGQVQVNDGGNTVTVKNADGSAAVVGDGAAVPDGFPKGMVYTGAKVTAALTTPGSSPDQTAYMVTLETSDKPDAVKKFYQDTLKSGGYTANAAEFSSGDGWTYTASTADNKSTASVTTSVADGKTSVVLGFQQTK